MSDVLSKPRPQNVYTHGPTIISMYNPTQGNWDFKRTSLVDSFSCLRDVAPEGCERVFAPIPTKANAEVAPQSMFAKERTFFRNDKGAFSVYGSIDADGVRLNKGDVFASLSADCHTLAMHGTSISGDTIVYAGHAGRDSVIDRQYLLSGTRSRGHFGIVETLLTSMLCQGVALKAIKVLICGGIKTGFEHDPQHPQYGEYNKILLRYYKELCGDAIPTDNYDIDMTRLLAALLTTAGIPSANITADTVDTYGDTDINSPLWASVRREPGTKQRNLVLVHHK